MTPGVPPKTKKPETITTYSDLIRRYGSTAEAARVLQMSEAEIWNMAAREGREAAREQELGNA